jgi:GNAT superfamily N-acetyltransferase
MKGTELEPYLLDLAGLRMKVFRDFPYLYDGDLGYEKKYLQTYLDHTDAAIVLAFDREKIVGASTAIPLRHEKEATQEPFRSANIDIDKVYYFGESVLLSEYRGRGVGYTFFAEREAAARENGCMITSFCAVERPSDHPRRPADWQPLDSFWKKVGYQKHPEIHTTYAWKDLDENSESMKPMIFWIKQL